MVLLELLMIDLTVVDLGLGVELEEQVVQLLLEVQAQMMKIRMLRD